MALLGSQSLTLAVSAPLCCFSSPSLCQSYALAHDFRLVILFAYAHCNSAEKLSTMRPCMHAAAHLAALELDEKAEAEYFKLEHRLKVQLGLIEETEAETPRR
eukprot:518244-Pelagomonas_calceolata.AAC.1